ncbi:MAG: metallophosphoesterase [Ignavibacteriaceae bacterium]|nr:metallophosphoesterase [Ignavibacteriaceae bacterium]
MKRVSIVYLLLILAFSSTLNAQVSTRKGWWKFDNPDTPLKAEQNYGSDLQLVGTHLLIDGPEVGNEAIKIGVGSHYKMAHGILPNGGGVHVNDYSIQIDFRVPAIDGWRCFFQTTPANNNDGDCFINTAGNIGTAATGYSAYAVKANEWYRLVISVKNGTQFKYYLDGQLLRNGTIQAVDGRFSLDSLLLVFADEDGEDKEIDCAELAIWDYSLTLAEVNSLGGYGHQVEAPSTKQLMLVPYLQEPTTNSVYVCWHDTLSTLTNVEYGTTAALGQATSGTSEIVLAPYRWHSVKLSGLQSNTEYFYKAVSGSGASNIYSFRTLPDSNYNGKIRFLLLSDIHSTDTTMAVKVIKEAKKKMQQLYGNDIQNQITMVLNSGDLVVDGSNIIQWTDEYFAPMSPLSPNIPTMTVTGNHEGEHQNYYKYMHYDDVSPFPAANEKFWSFRIANTLFIGLNSNAISTVGTLQKTWLDQIILPQAEADSTIDFVFVISHHFSITELWGEGITYDGGPNYITNQIYPILKKYSKVVQHSYGHTHGFERGTIESVAINSQGDFRIVCGGGGGGATDRWGAFKNTDFPAIQITYDNYFFQLVEIDAAKKTFESSMYSLGNASKNRDSELMDKWYRRVNQPAPGNPVTSAPTVDTNKITFNTSKIGSDSLMTVKIQVAENENFAATSVDTLVHWKNIYGVDAAFNPIDLNSGVDLTKLSFKSSRFTKGKLYYYRVKYRDHNLKWSDWSNVTSFNTLSGVRDYNIPTVYALEQNFPNPFNPTTKINYQLPKNSFVTLKIFDVLGNEISTLVNEEHVAGNYQVFFNGSNLSSGVYFYKIQAGDFVETKKLILMK